MKEPRTTRVGLTPGTLEPVTVAALKAWLKLNGSGEDAMLGTLITTARTMAERITRRAIVEQEFVSWYDGLPQVRHSEWWQGVREGAMCELNSQSELELPYLPLVSVEAVSTFDDADVATVISASEYFVDASDQDMRGRIVLRNTATWPYATRAANGLKVAFTAGYDPVPADIAHAVMLMAAYLYNNRGDCSDDACAGGCGAMSFLRAYVFMRPTYG